MSTAIIHLKSSVVKISGNKPISHNIPTKPRNSISPHFPINHGACHFRGGYLNEQLTIREDLHFDFQDVRFPAYWVKKNGRRRYV